MKTDNNGNQISILKVFRGASKNERSNGGFYDLIKVKYSNGKTDVICSSEISN